MQTKDFDEDVFFHVEDVVGEGVEAGTEIEFGTHRGPRATKRLRSVGGKLDVDDLEPRAAVVALPQTDVPAVGVDDLLDDT